MYVREKQGSVTLVRSVHGAGLMVDTSAELDPADWDRQIQKAYDLGYELTSDEPDDIAGPWAFYIFHPIKSWLD
jgi:hypothetical protein